MKSFELPHRKTYLHVILAAFMGVSVSQLIHPINGLTEEGVMLLAIVIPTIYLWLTVNTHWVSLLFLALLTATGMMTPNQVWAGSLGHFAIMLVLCFSLISEGLNENGVIEKIATWFMTRKFVNGRPYAFIAMFLASNLVIGIFMQNLALAVMYVALTEKICQRIGVKRGESLYRALMLGTFWGSGVLSIASPIAKTLPNILIGLVDTQFDRQITYAQWLLIGVPFSVVMFGVIMLVIRGLNPDVSALKNLDIDHMKKNSQPLNKRGLIMLIAMGFLIAVILLPELFLIFNLFTEISTYFVNLGVIVPAIFTVAILSVIHVKDKENNEPVMNFTNCSKRVPINLLLFVSAVVIMGTPLASETTGIIVWMTHLLTPLTTLLSPFWLFTALIIIAVGLTNFLSNTVVITVFFSLGAAVFSDGTMNPLVFSVLMAFAASMACLTPSSTITAPLYYGPKHLSVGEVIKVNLAFLFLASVVLIAFIPIVSWVIG